MSYKSITLCINPDSGDIIDKIEEFGKINDVGYILISNESSKFTPFPLEIAIRKEDLTKCIDLLQTIKDKIENET